MSFRDQLKQGLACRSIDRLDSVPARLVCLAAHPGRILLHPFRHHYKKHYEGKVRHPRLVFGLDMFFGGVVIALLAVGIFFSFYKPTSFGDKILFSASVAPMNVISGGSSTLIIHYVNNTGEDLNNVQLSLGYPAHFMLQDLSTDLANPGGPNTFNLGTVKAGADGNIKIRGVMFGDVGGKQTFRSDMTFTHGKNNTPDEKIDEETFSPTQSALKISVDAPTQLYVGETVSLHVSYSNTGPIPFPAITVQPVWPAGFSAPNEAQVLTAPTTTTSTAQSGSFTFNGTVEAAGTLNFEFDPSFTFDDVSYKQVPVNVSVPVAPAPLMVSHSVDEIRPDGISTFTVSYQNISDQTISNAQIGIETSSPIFAKSIYTVGAKNFPALVSIAPGATGTVTVRVPVLNSIQQSDLAADGSFKVATHAYASYNLGVQSLVSRGTDVTTTPVTPFVFAATAHYTAPSGDQIGLGPLPPAVGQTTTYWIFWTVNGTINPLSNINITGVLPAGVEFTGRQTVSQGNGVNYDPSSRAVSWNLSSADASLPSGNKSIGAAFELAITPTTDQVGTSPKILTQISATATDATTGANLIASSPDVTTNLPNDPLAAGNGTVASQ